MSILLEALRKSEKDQQKLVAPSIHSDEQSKSKFGLVKIEWLLMILVVLIAGGTFAWYQYQKPETAYQPPVTLKSDPVRAGDGKQKQVNDKNKPLEMAVSGGTDRPRTPVETYQKPVGSVAPTVAKDNPDRSMMQEKKLAMVVKNKPPANKPVANKATSNKQASTKPAANKKALNIPATKQLATRKPDTTSSKKFRPQQPAPISYWELPDSIRAKIPEMKFTVLVYASDPADRFVLIDGQRFGQGEQVQPELYVREIRRKGVVFRYNLYKFLVER